MRRKKPDPETVEMDIDGVTCLFLGGTPDEKALTEVRQVVSAYTKAIEHMAGYKKVRASLDSRAGTGEPPIDDSDLVKIGRWPGITVDGKPIAEQRGG